MKNFKRRIIFIYHQYTLKALIDISTYQGPCIYRQQCDNIFFYSTLFIIMLFAVITKTAKQPRAENDYYYNDNNNPNPFTSSTKDYCTS